MMCDDAFFSKDPSQWDEAYQSLWGCHGICPILEQFHIAQVTQPELSSLTRYWCGVTLKDFLAVWPFY